MRRDPLKKTYRRRYLHGLCLLTCFVMCFALMNFSSPSHAQQKKYAKLVDEEAIELLRVVPDEPNDEKLKPHRHPYPGKDLTSDHILGVWHKKVNKARMKFTKKSKDVYFSQLTSYGTKWNESEDNNLLHADYFRVNFKKKYRVYDGQYYIKFTGTKIERPLVNKAAKKRLVREYKGITLYLHYDREGHLCLVDGGHSDYPWYKE